jgi:tRNA-2-methylthio-N6-dimethylallyladenosine synthase
MNDDVCYQEKLERLNRLQNIIKENTLKISQGMIGTEQTILVEKQSKKMNQQISGRTENNRWVNFDGPMSLIGQFIKLHITEALSNSLRARLIN